MPEFWEYIHGSGSSVHKYSGPFLLYCCAILIWPSQCLNFHNNKANLLQVAPDIRRSGPDTFLSSVDNFLWDVKSRAIVVVSTHSIREHLYNKPAETNPFLTYKTWSIFFIVSGIALFLISFSWFGRSLRKGIVFFICGLCLCFAIFRPTTLRAGELATLRQRRVKERLI